MNKVFLQLWEVSNSDVDVISDGCSIHIDNTSYVDYISNHKLSKLPTVPSSYERLLGSPIFAFVSDSIFDIIVNKKSLRISESEFNNLIFFEDIIINND